MMQLIVTISELQTRLEGSTALNIYLLNKLGGQLTINQSELERVVKDFDTLHFSAQNDAITIKLCTSGTKPTILGKEGA